MRIRLMLFGTVLGTVIGVTVSRVIRWWRTWGADPVETTRRLPGDEVVPSPVASETRGITIDAPPEQIWPWLVQMGYGRAGWYSYDRLDQRGRSADGIVEAWQALEVGDIVPTYPGGGFEVAAIEPGRSLVLRSDTALVTEQAAAFAERQAGTGAAPTSGEAGTPGPAAEPTTVGVTASGALLGATPQQFSASWAFVIEPEAGGRSRLIERFRVWYGDAGIASHVVMPVVGFGVFVMMQRQMLGIRARAERSARASMSAPAATAPVTPPAADPTPPANGHDPAADDPELATSHI
jgi:hypothetical protein